MQSRKIQGMFCSNQASYMLSIVRRKLLQLCSRIRLLIRKRPRSKVIIRRLGRLSSKNHRKGDLGPKNSDIDLYGNGKMGFTNPKRPIRIATFNVAMFSLAPAISEAEEAGLFSFGEENYMGLRSPFEFNIHNKSPNCYPKGILKQSPLHNAHLSPESLAKQKKVSRSKLKVSINLPDNEISLAQSKLLSFMEDGSSIASRINRNNVIMRSPVCLPSTMLNFWNEGSLKSSRSIAEVLREVDADIIALQDVKAQEEKGMKPLSDLAAALGMRYVFAESWAPEYGNAILSKWPIKRWTVQKIADDDDFRNVLKATIEVPWAGEVNFYCTQLDHLDENWRMKQIKAITEIKNSAPHLLLGGLNSLNGSDYSSERWTDIVKYYEDIGKPRPRTEVMKLLRGKEYTDAKDYAGECEPVVIIAKGQNVQGTCKYGTRVDYILASSNSPYNFVPGSYSVISSKGTSDHHIVKADIVKGSEKSQQNVIKRHRKPLQKFVQVTNSSCSAGIWKINA
ncbi:Endonuclease/exonuclease/phosphatase [Corchorus capsularis]|uniref:Endonuclease/exonuclease/phosphatase n=1 Tax=Corchorus capsularis TaxID=210143 RepID=A0A1R3KXI2_COCAP|nr:Endonuclease/exonuclease/phosphatase [Corchorus capsularis]